MTLIFSEAAIRVGASVTPSIGSAFFALLGYLLDRHAEILSANADPLDPADVTLCLGLNEGELDPERHGREDQGVAGEHPSPVRDDRALARRDVRARRRPYEQHRERPLPAVGQRHLVLDHQHAHARTLRRGP